MNPCMPEIDVSQFVSDGEHGLFGWHGAQLTAEHDDLHLVCAWLIARR